MLTLDEGAVAKSSATPCLFPSLHQSGAARRLIFVTNRGPVEYHALTDGTFEARPGAGGVVSGLLCAARERPVSWISVAMTEGDRAVARAGGQVSIKMPPELSYLAPRLVYVPEQTYSSYYDEISNRLLWFAQHGLLSPAMARSPLMRAYWHEGYVAANRALAETVVAELRRHGEDTPVMFHDYHLYLAPAMVRQRVPRARLQHFTHVPWPAPDAWAGVPEPILRAIYLGLAACDVLGYQTSRDARSFLEGAQRYLPEAYISHDPDELCWDGHRTVVRAYPIALTPASVRESACGRAAVQQARDLRAQLRLDEGRQLIVRVDRVEPAKNIVRGFEAYERLLAEYPEVQGKVVFLALLVPSRESVPEYQAYAEQVRRAVERINATYAWPGWDPIVAIYGNDRARALACMRDYDVLLVNSLADGMNLVVKEGGLVNTRNGVIVLSERAGAYVQLRDAVLGISPLDVEGTTQALYRALTMPATERRRRAQTVRAILEREDAASWLGRQLADLMRVTGLPDEPDIFADGDEDACETADELAAEEPEAQPALLPHNLTSTDMRVGVQSAPLRAAAILDDVSPSVRHVRSNSLPLPRSRIADDGSLYRTRRDQEQGPPALSDLE
jgi:trehalose 6-phosphate synthase